MTNGTGQNSVVHGASGNAARASGISSVVFYSGNALGTGAVSIGQNTLSVGHGCFSQGWECYSGCSTPAGDAYLKNGDASKLPTGANRYCASFGIMNAAVQDAAFATGRQTTARGLNAFSGGYGTYADHNDSVALGSGTITGRTQQVVIGKANAIDNDAYFVIGNGTPTSNFDEAGKMIATDRRNAFVVKTNGNVEMGTSLKIGNTLITEEQLTKLLGLIK